ncbi:hypothetical protein Syun_018932 [Stephania yunnanensis]|uniref:Glycosyl transferase CAP10 domain-containing protein n=1 Tax=Stephania yunnanensis TaxID=152371 RepID=A0AAP0NXG8_9MAGN
MKSEIGRFLRRLCFGYSDGTTTSRNYFALKKASLMRSSSPSIAMSTVTPTAATLLFVLFLLSVAAFIVSFSVNSTIFNRSTDRAILASKHPNILPEHSNPPKKRPHNQLYYALNCSSSANQTKARTTCAAIHHRPPRVEDAESDKPPPPTCPDYFRWIHEDLRPWRRTGISRETVERARRTANFRLVVVGGRAYVERYKRAFQTRDVFTLWGVLQLLKRYPGRLPDLDLMFDCVDWPVIKSDDYKGVNATAPPPLFRYCSDDESLDIVFPDWSFWGWPEINIEPWDSLSKKLKKGNEKTKWMDRDPYAYWKGNPVVAVTRQDLLKCNVSKEQDWNARVYAQNWFSEIQKGFKESNLADQCAHRYKIYIEGSAWSVSEKYILACDSLALVVTPQYYDFFTRSLVPVQHYWPIKNHDKCRSIKFAVDWGNRHKKKVQEIGKAASEFILEDLKMEYVYDYMFHLLNEYAKLLRYKPTKPRKAIELCSESMACAAMGLEKKFMIDSMVKSSSERRPCTMPPAPPFQEVQRSRRRKSNLIKQVETWEEQFWQNQTLKQL